MPYLDDIIIFMPLLRNTLNTYARFLNDWESMKSNWNPGSVICLRERLHFYFSREKGYMLVPASVKLVVALKDSPPKTVNEVRKLMGFLNYYCLYDKNFSIIAKPIYDLVKTLEQPPQEAKQDKTKRSPVPMANYLQNTQWSGRTFINWLYRHWLTWSLVLQWWRIQTFKNHLSFILAPWRTG